MNSSHRWYPLLGKPDNISQLVVVHSGHDGGDEDNPDFGLGTVIYHFNLILNEIGAPSVTVNIIGYPVKLEVDSACPALHQAVEVFSDSSTKELTV